MTQTCAGERWYDDTWWEVDAPTDWSFVQDKSIKNFPYVFRSPHGSKLTIGVSKHVEVIRPAWQLLPTNLDNEAEKLAYQLIDPLACSSGVSKFVKQHFGVHVGFTYETNAENTRGWEGYFISDPWMVHPHFDAPKAAYEKDADTVVAILSSIRFFASQETKGKG